MTGTPARTARLLALALPLLVTAGALPAAAQMDSVWQARNQPARPQRIAGNLYYVGTADLTAFLLTGTAGHILLDGGLPQTAPLVLKSIRALGFRPEDVRVMLNSHAHFDHAGGLAELKRATGATLAASARDAELLERGGLGDFALGDSAGYPAVSVDRRLSDGDSVRVGDLVLIAHFTPGHTRGCTTWTTTVRDGQRDRTLAFLCSLSVLPNYQLVENAAYPTILADYRRSIGVIRQHPCEIMLAPHASLIVGFHDKLARIRSEGTAEALVDRNACRVYADRAERNLEQQLRAQQGGTPAGAR